MFAAPPSRPRDLLRLLLRLAVVVLSVSGGAAARHWLNPAVLPSGCGLASPGGTDCPQPRPPHLDLLLERERAAFLAPLALASAPAPAPDPVLRPPLEARPAPLEMEAAPLEPERGCEPRGPPAVASA